MFTWLIQMPHWFQVIFSAVVIIALIYGLIQLTNVLFRKNIFFNNSWGSFSFGNTIDCYTAPKNTCPIRKDVIILFNEVMRILYEKDHIIYVRQIKDQMNYAEQRLDQARAHYQKIYFNYLETHGVTKVVDSHSVNTYKLILKDFQKEILSKIRYSFRENHFDEMNESEFAVFVNNKFEYLMSELTEWMNVSYFYETDITRETLYKLNKEAVAVVKPIFLDVYHNARSLSSEYKMELKALDTKLETLLKKYE